MESLDGGGGGGKCLILLSEIYYMQFNQHAAIDASEKQAEEGGAGCMHTPVHGKQISFIIPSSHNYCASQPSSFLQRIHKLFIISSIY
jgi:hypothetical protein